MTYISINKIGEIIKYILKLENFKDSFKTVEDSQVTVFGNYYFKIKFHYCYKLKGFNVIYLPNNVKNDTGYSFCFSCILSSQK